MKTKNNIALAGEEPEVKDAYLSSPQKRAYVIHPTIYIGKKSRGTGKSTRIQAIRSMRIAIDVPRSVNLFYNATYIGLQTRTLPSTIAGWNHFGWKEGYHYVKNIAPPENWDRPYDYTPLNYKNTISIYNGSIFILGSNDRPGLVNSLSITGGVFIDEFRFINIERMQRDLNAAIRGNTQYWGKNPHLFSMTITTDQPFPDEDSYDYLKDMQKTMNQTQVYLIAHASIKVEKLKIKILKLKEDRTKALGFENKTKITTKITTLTETLNKKQKVLDKIRHKSTYFDEASAISNIHILKPDYLLRNADGKFTSKLIFNTSFLNIEPDEIENKFYSRLSAKHFIHGNFKNAYKYFDKNGINFDFKLNSSHILDCDPKKELDLEIDFGDMCSASISQTFGREERYIASFEVLRPFDVEDLMVIINDFFKSHSNKKINIYKDPSGNYSKSFKGHVYGQQTITKLKSLGWFVFDKTPEGSINPTHDAKHQLINKILKEDNPRFPFVRIIHETNINLETSLKLAPSEEKITRMGKKEIRKIKSSEKKTKLEDKPAKTTDHSDHFDIKLWHKYNRLLSRKRFF